MKKTLLSLVAMLSIMTVNAADVRTWDFTKGANYPTVVDDATNWKLVSKGRYCNVAALDNDALLLNGEAFGLTKGLTFKCAAEKIMFGITGEYYMQCQGTVVMNIPSVAKGDTLVIGYCSNNKSNDATISGNISENLATKATSKQTAEVYATADGDLALTMNNRVRVYTLTVKPCIASGNTVKAGKYIAQVTIAEANGVTVPDGFQAYVGTHKFGMDLAGDAEKMTISGLSILNNFEIVGDAIAYDATKTFTMDDKEFTICSADGTKTEGQLAVKKNEDGSISIEDFGFMRGSILAGTAKNITAVLQENKETEANITFEDVDLQGATYYNGADEAGLIATAGDFSFMNYYDPGYGSWNGFAVSATRSDIYTGNWGDDSQFNSCVAGGMQSEKFAIGYYSEYNVWMDDQYPEIYATKNIKPEYAYITNTAWAVKSMTEGDDYAKKFDETDWLKLTISGMVFDEEEEDYVAQASVDFYLAKDGKIVDEWTKVDLTPLGVCEFIRFTMDSSDKSYGMMNTPAYFALDNMKASVTDDPTTAIKGIKNADKQLVKAVKVVKNGQVLIMKNGKTFNAAGALVK